MAGASVQHFAPTVNRCASKTGIMFIQPAWGRTIGQKSTDKPGRFFLQKMVLSLLYVAEEQAKNQPGYILQDMTQFVHI